MTLFAWIVLGLIAGFVSSNIAVGVAQSVEMEVVIGFALLLVAYYAVSRHSSSE